MAVDDVDDGVVGAAEVVVGGVDDDVEAVDATGADDDGFGVGSVCEEITGTDEPVCSVTPVEPEVQATVVMAQDSATAIAQRLTGE